MEIKGYRMIACIYASLAIGLWGLGFIIFANPSSPMYVGIGLILLSGAGTLTARCVYALLAHHEAVMAQYFEEEEDDEPNS